MPGEELLARIESSQAEHVQDQLVQPVHLLVDPFQEAEVHRLVVEGPVDQCLRVRLDRGERGLELVGGVGDEILPHPLEPAKVSHVVEDQHGPRRGIPRQGKGSSAHGENSRRAAQRGFAEGERHLALVGIRVVEPQRLVDGALNLRTTDQLRHQPAYRRGIEAEQRIGAGVGKKQAPPRVHRDHRFGHRPEHDAQLLAVLLQPVDAALDRRCRLVEDTDQAAHRAPDIDQDLTRAPSRAQRRARGRVRGSRSHRPATRTAAPRTASTKAIRTYPITCSDP